MHTSRTEATPPTLLDMFRVMLTARRFDEAQIRFYKTGAEKMESVHSYIGQEAIGVGLGFAMRPGDRLLPSLRSRPAFFALGVPIVTQWAGVLGRASSPGKGLISSRHMTAPEYGIVGTTGIVGAQVPVATGVAMALKAVVGQHAAVCLFGDGAANRGDVHEGMNMAGVYKAPVVFVCEANGVAESQEWDSYMPISDLSVRAAGYGMPGVRIDGNDVEAVHAAGVEALARARAGHGPSLIVAETCRLRGHVEGLPDFRGEALLKSWQARDPIVVTQSRLMAAGLLTEAELAALSGQIDAEIDAALVSARAEPPLDQAQLPALVFFGSPAN